MGIDCLSVLLSIIRLFEDVGDREEGGRGGGGGGGGGGKGVCQGEAQNYGSFHFTSDSHTCNILLLIL